jgi:putative transposase
MKPAGRRTLVRYLEESYRVSERRSCEVLAIARSSHRYRSIAGGQAVLRMRIRDIASVRVRYGYKRIHVLLQRERWKINHKRVYRLYCEEGLNIRKKKLKKRARMYRFLERKEVRSLNECWSMDFASDGLFSGKRFRVLTVVDIYSRKCLGVEVAQGIKGEGVVSLLEQIKSFRGVPGSIRCDNGPEFISKAMDKWAYENGVKLDFSRPGKPTDNAFAESFIGSFRDECLNVNWFLSLEDTRDKIETWKVDYNECRPHSSIRNMTPSIFASMEVKNNFLRPEN